MYMDFDTYLSEPMVQNMWYKSHINKHNESCNAEIDKNCQDNVTFYPKFPGI